MSAAPVTPFHRILVAWDASPAARTALTTAMAIAHGKGLVIARAVLTPPQHTETGGEQSRDLGSRRVWLQDQFDHALDTSSHHGARVRLEWGESNDIPTDLCAHAERHGCDLIVLGRHGDDSRLRTAGLGPVAQAVSARSALPVLLVSTPRGAEPGQP
ncbi:universal stress protein [Streptomyces sp. NPDC059398]|uniref:universal stress protein n=1 Tax=Streptomyces sp. NPDC059398 TaxID=3346820 RepID=UPI0036BF1A89